MRGDRFAGRVAIVTGSGSGIGEEAVKRFSAEGGKVAVLDIDEAAADRVASEIGDAGGESIAIRVDVTDRQAIDSAVLAVNECWGRIDILVNNAGFTRDALLTKMGDDDFKSVVDVILYAAFACTRAVATTMIEQRYGRIVNVSSRAYLGNPGQSNYAAAKAGLIGLTRTHAKELGRHEITVNAIAPGLTETPLVRDHPNYEKMKERALRSTSLPRLATPADIANAILFLASDEASYITGDVLHVTGGRFS